MANHTTNEVYDELKEVRQQLDKNTQQEVTAKHFDDKIAELKQAIEKGGKGKGEGEKKEEEKKKEPQGVWDLIKDKTPIKETLQVFKQFKDAMSGGDLVSKVVLFAGAVSGAVALVGVVKKLIAGWWTSVKNIMLTFTGRKRERLIPGIGGATYTDEERKQKRKYYGRKNGQWGWHQEESENGEQPEGGGAEGENSQRPNLPSVEEITRVKDAMAGLNTEMDTYRGKVRGIATPRAMKQMASAAKKLESAAKKARNIDNLSESIGRLETAFRGLATASN
ncbi:hypothetical protein AQJ66_14200 [Streptomyces bungoensis]|uniref:Uncharacterized protein n=1 Tax=Streptomyces bungoensis TaxID=285568 RepID=A0A101T3X8_9ACTN|nr:hypothetical protein [Streptomyces bungoensis]KUN85302.1 hypothetical protein AQJ66_14200 [Streptomyces bungoensis]